MIKTRRSVRDFKISKIDNETIKNAILAAGSAPSGANLQPWHFVIIKDKIIKKKLKKAAEQEEFNFYNYKASKEWLEALKPLGTNNEKGFLTKAPVLIAIFEQKFTEDINNSKNALNWIKQQDKRTKVKGEDV